MSKVYIKCKLKSNYLMPWKSITDSYVFREGNCIPIKKNNMYFLITARHVISYALIINIIINDKEFVIDKKDVFSIDGYDISILNITKYEFNNLIEYISNDDIEIKAPDKDIKYLVKSYNNRMTLIHHNIVFEYTLNPYYPRRVLYENNLMSESSAIDEDSIKGFSGSPVFKDDKLVAMMSFITSKHLYTIPSYVLMFFLNDFITHNKIIGMHSFGFDYDIVNGIKIIGNDDTINGIHITNDHEIEYGREKIKIGNNNIILEIQHDDITLNFDKKGYVYDKELNYSIPFDSYISLHRTTYDLTILNLKFKKVNKIIIEPRIINTITNIKEYDNNIKYISINNYIISTPSTYYLELYQSLIGNNIYDIYKLKRLFKYINDTTHDILILDTLTPSHIINPFKKNFYYKIISINDFKINSLSTLIKNKSDRNRIKVIDYYDKKIVI
jgi:hypothetical protein